MRTLAQSNARRKARVLARASVLFAFSERVDSMARMTTVIQFRASPRIREALKALGGRRKQSATIRELIEREAKARGVWKERKEAA